MIKVHLSGIPLNSTFANHEHTDDAKERIAENTLEYHVQRIEDGVVKQTYHDLWDAVEWIKNHSKTKAKDESIYKRIQFAIYGCDDTKSAYGYQWRLDKIPGKQLKEED